MKWKAGQSRKVLRNYVMIIWYSRHVTLYFMLSDLGSQAAPSLGTCKIDGDVFRKKKG